MPDWEDRITGGTAPATLFERVARYRLAAPLIRAGRIWCDIGCGDGVAAADALEEAYPGRLVLVDDDERAVAAARRELGGETTDALVVDLGTEEGVARLVEVLRGEAHDGLGTITCFETIPRLERFPPLVEALVELAGGAGYTVVLSVPNAEVASTRDPRHRTLWGAGAVEELRRLLPDDHVLVRQLALRGSALLPAGREEASSELALRAGEDAVPTHFLVAFGPRASALEPVAGAVPADLTAERLWERERESDAAYFEEAHRAAQDELAQARAHVEELERRLGKTDRALPVRAGDGAT